MKEKVVVGMSGGVDSSVAAYLLKEQGYDVIGVTMQIWQDDDSLTQVNSGCCGLSGIDDARSVARMLGIQYYVMNFEADFRKNVVDYFISEYLRGRTPNPCNACNRYVKWESLLARARQIGADYIATGHYARVNRLANGRYAICKSATAAKDQTYALYALTQEQLSHTLMPIGEYEKSQVREIAAQLGLPVAAKHDSQDICFIPDHDYAGFISREIDMGSYRAGADGIDDKTGIGAAGNNPESQPGTEKGCCTAEAGRGNLPGNFVNMQGNVLGTHKGIINYTIGQRKGLGISAPQPLFVKEIRPDTNEVVLCNSDELFSDTCILSDVNYMACESIPQGGVDVIGKLRYSHKGSPCRIYSREDGWVEARFEEPQRAITPGQAAVFYEGDHILCGGVIEQ